MSKEYAPSMSPTDLKPGDHHYRAFVGPPQKYDIVGAMQFNLLTLLGLREEHSLLDIGCGSLRAGRLLIPYLVHSRYFGIEPEKWLIEEGIEQELGQDIIRIKKPRFSNSDDFKLSVFGQSFDYILAQSIFSHASVSQIKKCLDEASQVMTPVSIFIATFIKGEENNKSTQWVYPGCVTYTLAFLKELAAQSNLALQELNWPHPNGQTWVLFTDPSNIDNIPHLP